MCCFHGDECDCLEKTPLTNLFPVVIAVKIHLAVQLYSFSLFAFEAILQGNRTIEHRMLWCAVAVVRAEVPLTHKLEGLAGFGLCQRRLNFTAG